MSTEDTPTPEATQRSKTGAELRAHPRFRHMAGATCRWQEGGEHFALLVNLSAGGARLMVRMDGDLPSLAAVELRGKSAIRLEVPARTVYAENRNGLWLLGCAFHRELTVAEILDFAS